MSYNNKDIITFIYSISLLFIYIYLYSVKIEHLFLDKFYLLLYYTILFTITVINNYNYLYLF